MKRRGAIILIAADLLGGFARSGCAPAPWPAAYSYQFPSPLSPYPPQYDPRIWPLPPDLEFLREQSILSTLGE